MGSHGRGLGGLRFVVSSILGNAVGVGMTVSCMNLAIVHVRCRLVDLAFGVHRCLRTCICKSVSRDDSCCEAVSLDLCPAGFVDRLFPVEKLGETVSLDSFGLFNLSAC